MREIPKSKNTVFISSTISTNVSIEDCFQFVKEKFPECYQDLSDGHKYFRVVSGNPLAVGEEIECAERAGNQSITHKYVVHEVVQNERIYYLSKPSLVKIKLPWAAIDSESNTYVYYDFTREDQDHSLIRLTIGIQFQSMFERLFSQLFMGILPWKKHCLEEMDGLKQVLESSIGQ
ncbi:MAG: hypothetical protein JXJ17_19835 [Anaerolineae bacterium]|nr:hypothetical protein [Anaerolineae bacterium]